MMGNFDTGSLSSSTSLRPRKSAVASRSDAARRAQAAAGHDDTLLLDFHSKYRRVEKQSTSVSELTSR